MNKKKLIWLYSLGGLIVIILAAFFIIKAVNNHQSTNNSSSSAKVEQSSSKKKTSKESTSKKVVKVLLVQVTVIPLAVKVALVQPIPILPPLLVLIVAKRKPLTLAANPQALLHTHNQAVLANQPLVQLLHVHRELG